MITRNNEAALLLYSQCGGWELQQFFFFFFEMVNETNATRKLKADYVFAVSEFPRFFADGFLKIWAGRVNAEKTN